MAKELDKAKKEKERIDKDQAKLAEKAKKEQEIHDQRL